MRIELKSPLHRLDDLRELRHVGHFVAGEVGGFRENSLLAEHVIAARALARAGVSSTEIGRKFGVGLTCIGKAIRGDTWKHLNSISQPVTE